MKVLYLYFLTFVNFLFHMFVDEGNSRYRESTLYLCLYLKLVRYNGVLKVHSTDSIVLFGSS